MKCSVCNAVITAEDPAVLTVGRMGNARYLCPDCDAALARLTRGKTPEEINEAKDLLLSRLENNSIIDPIVNETVADLFTEAAERADAIRAGTFDFEAEEAADAEESDEDVPEDLRETEEDRERDRQEDEKNKKIDKVFNWIWAVVFAGMLAAMIWLMFFR